MHGVATQYPSYSPGQARLRYLRYRYDPNTVAISFSIVYMHIYAFHIDIAYLNYPAPSYFYSPTYFSSLLYNNISKYTLNMASLLIEDNSFT
jgi:hypothetical protein